MLIAGASDEWTTRVRDALADSPMDVSSVTAGSEALQVLKEKELPLLVVGTTLEDMSGLALCRRVRESDGGTRVLVLTVSRWADEMDRILAFECGADDFSPDPFFPRELTSRVLALLRRGRRKPGVEQEGETRVGALRIDSRKTLVEVEGQPISLTWREFELLRLLAQQRGRVVRRSELIALLIGRADGASPRLIDTHVKSIRRKLGDSASLIETVRGVGYRLASS